MTRYGPLRAKLADQYVQDNTGMMVRPNTTGAHPGPLMHSYLQFLTGRRISAFMDPNRPGEASPLDWEGEHVGAQLMRWADYTPGPYVPVGQARAHRGTLWPWMGDIVVFAAGNTSQPDGGLGIYLDHEGTDLDATWHVFTQGPGPATTQRYHVQALIPVGWWRVKDEWLEKRSQPTRAMRQVPA